MGRRAVTVNMMVSMVVVESIEGGIEPLMLIRVG